MKRSLVLLLLGLLAVPTVLAGIPTNYFCVHCKGGFIHAEDGKLWVSSSSTEQKRDASDHLYLGGGSLKSSVGAGYLAYDLTGKSNKLVLSSATGDHTVWHMVQTRGTTPGDRDEITATIRAANGPMKGWVIDVEAGQLILSKTASKPARAERVILHK